MSNNLLIILGATLLGLLILVSSSVYYAFAQQEEEEEEDEDKNDKDKDSKDKEEEEEEKDKDKEKKDEKGSKDDEEEGEEQPVPPANNNVTQQQQPQQNVTEEEVINTTTAAIQPLPTPAPPEAPVLEEAITNKEFNATCQCMTTSSTPPPSNNDTAAEEQKILIPISSANIKNFESFGEVTDPAYTSFYTVSNLLDNTIDDVSFWSQAGPSSGFYIKLDSTLDNYQVCSMELNVHNPKNNAPYLLDIGVSKNYSGVIDQTNEIIQFDSCVRNMDEILMTFNNPSNGFISIAEMKLFGGSSSTAASTNNIAEVAPTTTATNKINIENSEAEIDIKNSTVTFKFDPLTATFVSTAGDK